MQFVTVLLYIVLTLTSLFLICLVLIQRGKGGGLAGAFGGAGGSSAFGTKAGDVFTKVTMITAAIWIALNMLLVVISNHRTSAYERPDRPGTKSDFKPANPSEVLDKAGKGTTIELPPNIPPPPPSATKAPTGAPVPEVSSGSPSAPVPPEPIPAPLKKP